MNLPDSLVQRIAALDPSGRAWLDGLPELLETYADRWSITIHPPFANLTYHYVAPATCADGTPAVIKAGLPLGEFRHQVAALRLCDGRGSVKLIDADVDGGVMLLERLSPGTPLTALATEAHDGEATAIAASVMQDLWRPAPIDHDFPTVSDWAQGFERLRIRFDGGTGPLPSQWVDEAAAIHRDHSESEAVLLHGDLHHDNILAAGSAWRAIDPKGLIGEPVYETAQLLCNLWRDRHTIDDPGSLTRRRIAILSEALGIDNARIADFAYARAVLSAWWSIEDGCAPDLDTAEMLRSIAS